MFTRATAEEPKPIVPPTGASPVHSTPSPHQQPRPSEARRLVIGSDLKIVGKDLKIRTPGTLQVDGEVEGRVDATEVIVGEKGKVTGTVVAERVIVRGTLAGEIRGVTVALQASSHVKGEIHHVSLIVEQGAKFDGRCRRAVDAASLEATKTAN
jgi:cytoskeletal protein CcmA (bactofilin family)